VLEWYESTPDIPNSNSIRSLSQFIENSTVKELNDLLYLQEIVNDRLEHLLQEAYEVNNPGHWYTCSLYI